MRRLEKEGAACLFKHRPHDHRVPNAFSQQQFATQLHWDWRNYPSARCADLKHFLWWIFTDYSGRHARYIIRNLLLVHLLCRIWCMFLISSWLGTVFACFDFWTLVSTHFMHLAHYRSGECGEHWRAHTYTHTGTRFYTHQCCFNTT